MAQDRIESLVSPAVIKEFQDLTAGVRLAVAEVEALISSGTELNKALAAQGGFKKTIEGIAALDDAEERLTKKTAELTRREAELDSMLDKLSKKMLEVAKNQENLNKHVSVAGRVGDVVKQSMQEYASSTEIASKIVKEYQGNIRDMIKWQLTLKSELEQVRDAQKNLDKQIVGTSTEAIERKTERLAELAEKEALIKQQLHDVNVTIKQQAREMAATEGSIDEFTATLDRLQKLYKSLSRSERESASGKELLAAIQELDPAVKGFNESIGQFQRSVGNYAKGLGGFTSALDVLRSSASDVKKRMDDITQSGNVNTAVLDELRKEYELLSKIIESQATGFANMTQELKANETALASLKTAGFENTEAYKALFAEVARGRSELTTLRKEMTTAGRVDLGLQASIQSAQALTGVYGIAQGAAALFGQENEELQKTFVKLQAVMTVLNGLQAVSNALKKESAVRAAISIGLEKASLAVKKLETAAESKNIVVKYAAIAAQKTMNAVMSLSNPIALTILGTIGLLTIAYSAFGGTAKSVTKDIEQLSQQFQVNSKFLDGFLVALKNRNQEVISQLRARFATEEEIRKAETEGLQREEKALQGWLDSNRDTYDSVVDIVRKYEQIKRRLDLKLTDEQKEFFEKAQGIYDEYENMSQEHLNKVNELKIKENDNLRVTIEESAELRRKELQLQIDNATLAADLFKRQSEDQERSYDERIDALKKYAAEQQKISDLIRRQGLAQPGLTDADRKQVDSQANIRRVTIERDTNRQLLALQKEFEKRQREVRFEILRLEIEDRRKAADLIAEDEKRSYSERIKAVSDSYTAQRQLVVANSEKELEAVGLTAEERKVIQARTLSQLNDLEIEFGKKQQEIIKANNEAINRDIQTAIAFRAAELTKAQAEEISLINEARASGQIGEEKYQQLRTEIERKYRIASLQEDINATQAKVMAAKEGTQERADAERELAELVMQLSDEVKEKQIANYEAIAKKIQETVEIVNGISSVVSGFLDASITKNKNAIEEQLKKAEQAHEIEMANINALALSEEERANRTIVAEAKLEVARRNAERRRQQEDMRRARFEKAQSILNIILNTAQAVVKALPNIPLSIIVGAIGAAQLAAAIATPIPQYAEGIYGNESHPGGPAIVGDGGKSEYIVTPDGGITRTTAFPTLMNIPKDSQVFPDLKTLMEYHAVPRGLNVDVSDKGYERFASTISSKLDMLNKTIKNKREIHISRKGNGWEMITREGNAFQRYLNDRL